jgi:hypothetical protein
MVLFKAHDKNHDYELRVTVVNDEDERWDKGAYETELVTLD